MLRENNVATLKASAPGVDWRGLADRLAHFLPLLVGVAMAVSNRWFTVVDDECAIIDRAAQPLSKTANLFLHGLGQHEHPPLYDFLLHGWLRLTNGNMHLLRIPAIVFYVLGAWALASAARALCGPRSQTWVLILVALWPYGFHFGRVTTWYSFSFLIVSLLTVRYLKYVEDPGASNWAWVLTCSIALIYTSYFGWALLACLALDFIFRTSRNSGNQWRPLLVAGAVLLAAYLPVLPAFVGEIRHGVHETSSASATILGTMYNLYCLFVSESVAPWYWALGVPASVAAMVCIVASVRFAPAPAKRFMFYFAGLFVVMTILGIANQKRLMLIAAWLILPVGVVLGTMAAQATRRALVASLVVIAAIGWFGIFSRKLYAAPRWVEPWDSIARQAAEVVNEGGVVVGNNPSFFFYLTYRLPPMAGGREGGFPGLLPVSARRANVYDPTQWIDAGQPVGHTVLFVKGLQYGMPVKATVDTERWLDAHCAPVSADQLVHDLGAKWKQRYSPATGQLEWRITTKSYECR